MVPLWQVALHKVPTTAGRKSAMPFRHGHYLTTLHSYAHVKQTQIYFETWDCDLWRPMASGASQTAYGGQHKSATPFYHGYYLTTLLSCAQVKQTQNLYFETRDFDL